MHDVQARSAAEETQNAKECRRLSDRNLRRCGHDLEAPFLLYLIDDAGKHLQVKCCRLLRILPGKRLVAVALIQGRQQLLKLYFGRRARHRMQRELTGLQQLQQLNLPAPRLDGVFHSAEEICALALNYYPDALNLGEALRASSAGDERLHLVSLAAALMADMHKKGVMQKDAHPGNWLLAGEQLLVIDGDQLVCDLSLSDEACMQNLAEFYAGLPPAGGAQLAACWSAYRRAGGLPSAAEECPPPEAFAAHVRRARKKCLQKLSKKYLRSSTLHYAGRSWHDSFAAGRRDMTRVQPWLSHPDSLFDDALPLHLGRSATVARFSRENQDLVVKRYNIKSGWHWLRRCLRPTRARRAWQSAHLLRELEIGTLLPVFFLEKRLGPFFFRSYLVYSYTKGMDLLAALRRADAEGRRMLLGSLTDMLLRLQEAEVFHGDMKASNILMNEAGIFLLDLDSVNWNSNQADFAAGFKKDLARLLRNFDSYPELHRELSTALAAAGIVGSDLHD